MDSKCLVSKGVFLSSKCYNASIEQSEPGCENSTIYINTHTQLYIYIYIYECIYSSNTASQDTGKLVEGKSKVLMILNICIQNCVKELLKNNHIPSSLSSCLFLESLILPNR